MARRSKKNEHTTLCFTDNFSLQKVDDKPSMPTYPKYLFSPGLKSRPPTQFIINFNLIMSLLKLFKCLTLGIKNRNLTIKELPFYLLNGE